MKKSILVLISVLISVHAVAAQGFPRPEEPDWSLRFTFTYEQKEYAYYLDFKRLESSPNWNPKKDDPPLSPTRAVAVAKEQMEKLIKVPYGWDVQSLDMSRAFENKWFYSITFGCIEGRCSSGIDRFIVFVKMNGSAVEPTIRKKK